jgi:hypothetical protein
MQAEKKQLEKNVLAEHLTQAYEGLKQGPSRGTLVFVGVAVAAVLLFFLFRYFYVSSETAASQRWLKLDEVVFPEQIDGVVEEVKDSPQYRIARFKEARTKMSLGLRELGSFNQKEAMKQIQDATVIYEELAKSAGRIPLLHQEALAGTARGYESQGGVENIDKAIENYEKLARDYPKSALGVDARKQLDRLNSESTKQDLRELTRELNPSSKID